MEPPKSNAFAGMSSLRAQERGEQPLTDKEKSLQAYLKKYSDAPAGEQKGKKKKRKKQDLATLQGVKIIDEDQTGFVVTPTKRAKLDKETQDSDEDAPVVANPGEAELYARLLQKEQTGTATKNWVVVDNAAESEDKLPRRQRRNSPDASPPRRQRHDSPDASPPRRQRHDSPDASPPRRQRRDSPDAFPAGRQRHERLVDATPLHRRRGSSSDISPPRKQRSASADASPPRRKSHTIAPSLSGQSRRPGGQDISPPRHKREERTLADGVAAGMVSGEALTAQLERKRVAERERFLKMEAESGSRHAETVYRNKETGRRVNKEEFEAAQQAATQKKRAAYEAPEWGGGVKQMRDREEAGKAAQREAARPFARTLDTVDEDLNLRDRVRFGDPMAHLARKQATAPPPPVIPQKLAKQMKKSGFVVPQDVLPHSWLRRKMGAPPNRYGIQPGRHWDGVDRSTGFEREMFKQQAAKRALEREARMWAQSDM